MNKGFTLLEVIVAILVIVVGVLAAFNVVQNIVSYTFQTGSRLTAAYLAMEGIEEVRNIRDTNWLEGEEWDNGISSTGWIAHPQLPKYERKVTIDNSVNDKLKVIVEVRWTEKGQTHTVAVQENLYNWF